jgi:hypothetical protein
MGDYFMDDFGFLLFLIIILMLFRSGLGTSY